MRKNTIVTVKDMEFTRLWNYPFINDLPMIFLGEIKNMRDHGIFVGKSGKVYWGYHTDSFRELTEEEV